MDYRLQQDQEGEAAQEGAEKMREEDYRGALALFIPLAEEGNAFALFNIGFISPFLLESSDPDIDRAFLTEDAELEMQFGHRWRSLPDWRRAEIKWYTRASAQGNPEAIYQLLHLYKHWNLGALPWHSLTGHLRELYERAENGGYFAGGSVLMEEIRIEMRAVGLNPKTVFHLSEVLE
jgi:hypothetical protein